MRIPAPQPRQARSHEKPLDGRFEVRRLRRGARPGMLVPRSDLGASTHHRPEQLDDEPTVAGSSPLPHVEGHEIPGSALRPGTVLGRYMLLEEVGSGGMGVVMAAYDRELDRRVALKLLRPDLSRSGGTRMRREAQALAKLQHPSVVSVFEVGTIEGQLFIAMEYVDGLTLDAWAARHRGEWRKIVDVAIRAGRGVAAAHAVGLVHRDIKPSNILVGQDGRVCVADFGIATASGRTVDSDVADPPLPLMGVAGLERSARPTTGSIERTRTLHDSESTSPTGRAHERASAGAMAMAEPETPRLDSTPRRTPSGEIPSLAMSTQTLAAASHPAWSIDADGLTEAGAVIGTPAFMSPEQHRGEPVDARSDQFAFCVALYRVLYDDTPFAGEDLETLRASVAAGRVKPPPSGTKVPASVRRVLLRGLAAQPERRWPSMRALLDALSRSLGRRRWWFSVIAAASVASAVVMAAVLPEPSATGIACPSAEERLQGVWDEERVIALREAFVTSALPYAVDAGTRTEQRLDRHATSWSERYQVLCAEMATTGASPALDLEMACLRGRREELRALVELLIEGDPNVVAKATQAAADLASVASCRSEGVEAAVMASPRPEQQSEVDEIRLTLARAEAAYKAGTFDLGIDLARSALAEARALGYGPVEVEAAYRLGMLHAMAGELDEAAEQLGEAALRSTEVRHDRIAARAAIGMAFVVGYQQGRPDDGMVWIRHGAAALERLEPDSGLDADLRATRAAVLSAQGRFDEALTEFRAALEQRERALGKDHPTVASSYNNLGSVLVELGRFDEALQALQHAKTIWEHGYGPRHPVVATALNGMGAVLEQMGRYQEGREVLEEALELREAIFGPDHINLAITLDNLGAVLTALGEYEEARAVGLRSLELRATHLGVRHPHYASSLVNLGLVAERLRHFDEACTYHRQAIEIWEEALGPQHPYLGHPLTSLGRSELALGHPKIAQEALMRALRIREAADKPSELAETRLALAQALWQDDPERARSLALQASADVGTAVHSPERVRKGITRWLAEHPAPPPAPPQ